MKLSQYAAPTSEPITIAEFLMHLRYDSGTFADNLTTYQSLAPGSHGVSAEGLYTHFGTGVDVLGHEAVVNLNSGACGTDGTNDTKIQESDDDSTYTDWTGGAFTQVTEANDNAIQEIAYTGSKQYIRTASKVLVAACVFGTEVVVNEATADDEDDLLDAITDGRERIEKETSRALFTQTWDAYLDDWPANDRIKLPFGNLTTVTSVSWKDTDGTETTLTEGTDYLVETNGPWCGYIVLPYGGSWPSGTLYPSNPIKIRFVCGWDDVTKIPKQLKRAVKLAAEDSYYHGDRREIIKPAIDSLLLNYRIWDQF